MKRTFIILPIILLFPVLLFCQQVPVAQNQPIPVCCGVTAADNEFSGLAKWRNYVLLIPQHIAEKGTHHIIAIDTASIDSVLQHQADSIYYYRTMLFDSSLQSVIQTIRHTTGMRNKYGGFEAAVAVDDSLFLTVETDGLCFVVKGIIAKDKGAYRVVFNPKDIMPLRKPDNHFENAGFESIAYLPRSKQLVSFYENNNLQKRATGYLFDTRLSRKTLLHFDEPLLFRLTDVATVTDSAGNDVLLGVNFFYNDFKKDSGIKITEFNYYLTGDTNKLYTSKQLSTAFAAMHNGNLLKDCFSRIVRLHIQDNTVYWQEVKMISNWCDNWEGITAYKNGVLCIIDGSPPGVNCTLSYFGLY